MAELESMHAALQVFIGQEIIFKSDGKWLYPLFDLEDFIRAQNISMARAFIHDKVVGKAAALLMVRLGAGKVHGELMSQLAHQTLTHFQVPHSYDRLVPRIDCQTESLLLDVNDPQAAYQILCQRAQRC